jgi:hypothetical protein
VCDLTFEELSIAREQMIEVQINKTNAVSFSELAPNLCRYHFAAKQHDHYFKRAPSIAFAIARTLLRNVFRKGQVQQIQG